MRSMEERKSVRRERRGGVSTENTLNDGERGRVHPRGHKKGSLLTRMHSKRHHRKQSQSCQIKKGLAKEKPGKFLRRAFRVWEIRGTGPLKVWKVK